MAFLRILYARFSIVAVRLALYLDKFYVLFMNFLPALYEFSNVMED